MVGMAQISDEIRLVSHGFLSLSKGVSLAKGKLHEVQGRSAKGFALSVAARTSGPVIWITGKYTSDRLLPAGVSAFMSPGRIILISVLDRQEALWSAEQALRTPGADCVVVELGEGPDLRESRRLQIAAEETGGVALALIARRAQTSAAHTRWSCEPACDAARPSRWGLSKSKDGQQGRWAVAYPDRRRGEHAPDLVPLAAASAA